MKRIVESPFSIELEGQEVDCVLHSFELYPQIVGEEAGWMSITVGDREPFRYAIWGTEYDSVEEYYICLPTTLEDTEDDELETYSLDVMLEGIPYQEDDE